MATATADPLVDRLRSLLGRDAVLANPSDLVVYECDAFTVEKNRPPSPLGVSDFAGEDRFASGFAAAVQLEILVSNHLN